MEVNEKLYRPITEVNYLRAENADRYRAIMRFFYHEHERIRYWLYKEDVYEEMKEQRRFADYTMEQCQNDLQALNEWGNLTAHQDTSKASTIQEFKNKRYRYQLSEYSVAIERMTIELEQMEIEGASLQPTLLERIRQQLEKFEQQLTASPQDAHGWWQLLSDDFLRLNKDYQDYIRTLNSARAEELMKSREFLVFKDQLIMYLRSFVRRLQEQGLIIEGLLKNIEEPVREALFDKIVRYELSIPRLGETLRYEQVQEAYEGKWKSLYDWFVGENGENEVDRLYGITNDIIRRITRYALQIGEFHHQGSNRREEYRHIADMFGKCKDLQQAHCFSAQVFGCESILHLQSDVARERDSIYQGVYEEKGEVSILEPRARVARKKSIRKRAQDHSLEQQILQMEIFAKQEEQQRQVEALIQNGKIVFSRLPELDEDLRKVLLGWISRAMGNSDHRSRNDQGKTYQVRKEKEGECSVVFSDGTLVMPCLEIVFEEEGVE